MLSHIAWTNADQVKCHYMHEMASLVANELKWIKV